MSKEEMTAPKDTKIIDKVVYDYVQATRLGNPNALYDLVANALTEARRQERIRVLEEFRPSIEQSVIDGECYCIAELQNWGACAWCLLEASWDKLKQERCLTVVENRKRGNYDRNQK